jgi:hypothetical protein
MPYNSVEEVADVATVFKAQLFHPFELEVF